MLDMRNDAVLAGAVIIRHDDQRRVGPGVFGKGHMPDGGDGIVRSASSNHRNTARRLIDADLDDMIMLVERQRRAFPGGAAWNQGTRTFGNLPLHQRAKFVFGKRSVAKRSHQSGN